MSSLSPLELDVRPLFAAGKPPLVPILNAVNRLEPGQSFRLIAPFEPMPLYEMLAGRGFTPVATKRDDGAWEILFKPSEDGPESGRAPETP